MNKKLAIKGHSARGKEVIELLEMLGGKNVEGFIGTDFDELYTIEDNCIIQVYDWNNCICFTLEEFLEKYPFKVGDKVEVCETGKVFTIGNMIWEDELCTVHYANMEDIEYYTAKELKLYKETNMKDNTTLNMSAIDYNNGLVGYEIPEGYEFDTVIDNKVVLKKLKPKYPTTFEECLNMLYCKSSLRTIIGHRAELLFNLEKLLICRDAYWKIVGEQMGLGKLWEPEYASLKDNTYFIIQTFNGEIDKSATSHRNAVLAFPTSEMRDTFYENFKDLIEQCKELL